MNFDEYKRVRVERGDWSENSMPCWTLVRLLVKRLHLLDVGEALSKSSFPIELFLHTSNKSKSADYFPYFLIRKSQYFTYFSSAL